MRWERVPLRPSPATVWAVSTHSCRTTTKQLNTTGYTCSLPSSWETGEAVDSLLKCLVRTHGVGVNSIEVQPQVL